MMIRKTHKGFSLLEMLMAISLIAMIVVGVFTISDQWLKRAVNRQLAVDVLRLQQAASDYVFTNFETLKKTSLNQFVKINVSDIKDTNFLPSGYTARNALKQDMVVYKRSRNIVPYYVIDVLVVSTNPSSGTIRIPNDRMLDAVRAGGPQMGLYSQIVTPDNNLPNKISSFFKGWSVDPSLTPLPGYAATPNGSGGYIAAFNIVSGEKIEANPDYLYRVSVAGQPQLNRMAADLRMNKNPIRDVGTMTADKVIVNGSAAFRGIAQGSASETSQALTVDQALYIESEKNDQQGAVRVNMKVKPGFSGCEVTDAKDDDWSRPGDKNGDWNRTLTGGNCGPSTMTSNDLLGGELQVISKNGDASMVITNKLKADGSLITNEAKIADNDDDKDMSKTVANGTSTFGTVKGNNMTVNEMAVTPETDLLGGARAKIKTLQASTLNLDGQKVDSDKNVVDVQGAMIAVTVEPGSGHTFKTKDMEVLNIETDNLVAKNMIVTDTLNIDNYGSGAGASYKDYHNGSNYRTIVCNKSGSYTYCEPTGSSVWKNSAGENVNVNCSALPAATPGYKCTHTRDTDKKHLGTCEYIRQGNGYKTPPKCYL